jgi:hypothetical protein
MRAFLPIEFRALSAAQTDALTVYRARWALVRRATGPADRAAAEQAVRLVYQAADLDPPARLVWCESPAVLAGPAWQMSRADGRNVTSALIHRLRRRVAGLIGSRVHRQVRAQVESAVNPADPLVASVADAVMPNAAHDDPPLLARLRDSRPLSPFWNWRALFGLDGAGMIGQHELSWLGPCDYFRQVLDLRDETAPLVGLFHLAASLGWLRPHEHTCWLVERPDLLRFDARDRLHSADGPALRFPDGWSFWAWKGVEVPSWLIEHPRRITLTSIDGARDVQVRRCMIEIMTPQRYVALGGAARVAQDETGILWRKAWSAADAWTAVEVINATPEPDGTRQRFFLQVPAHVRTAREAVAWTYGLSTSAYARLVLRT